MVFGCNCDCEPETQKPGRGSSEAALQSVPNKVTLPWGPVVSLRRVGLENWDGFEKQREVPRGRRQPPEGAPYGQNRPDVSSQVDSGA